MYHIYIIMYDIGIMLLYIIYDMLLTNQIRNADMLRKGQN